MPNQQMINDANESYSESDSHLSSFFGFVPIKEDLVSKMNLSICSLQNLINYIGIYEHYFHFYGTWWHHISFYLNNANDFSSWINDITKTNLLFMKMFPNWISVLFWIFYMRLTRSSVFFGRIRSKFRWFNIKIKHEI